MGFLPFLAAAIPSVANYFMGRHAESSAQANAQKQANSTYKGTSEDVYTRYAAARENAVANLRQRGVSEDRILAAWPEKPPAAALNIARPNVPLTTGQTPGLGRQLVQGLYGAAQYGYNQEHGNDDNGYAGPRDPSGTQWNTPTDVPGSHSYEPPPTPTWSPAPAGPGLDGNPLATGSAAVPAEHVDNTLAPPVPTPRVGTGVGTTSLKRAPAPQIGGDDPTGHEQMVIDPTTGRLVPISQLQGQR